MFFSNMFPESMPGDEERRRSTESATLAPVEGPPINDIAFLRRLQFVKWLVEQGRLSDWPVVTRAA